MMLENKQSILDGDPHREGLERYLTTVLQCGVALREWTGSENLPVFMTRVYRFFETELGHTPLLFLLAPGEERHTPAEVAKHLELAARAFDGAVVFSTNSLGSGFRARLMAAGIAFAVPGNQLYIPALATDLRERFKRPKPPAPARFSPSTQLALFFHVLHGERTRLTPTGLAKPLGYSLMTVSRAFEELAAAGLARVERRGRGKFLIFSLKRRPLIKQAMRLLIRPDYRLTPVRWTKAPPELPLAGEHALANQSDLDVPSTPPAYAASSEQMRRLLGSGLAETADMDYDSDAVLETWRYDPQVLAASGFVDPLSLYVQFRNHPDERVSMAADRMLERSTW